MSVSERSAGICVLLPLRKQLLRKVHLRFFYEGYHLQI